MMGAPGDDGYPPLRHHRAPTLLLLLLILELGWEWGLVRTKGLVGTKMLSHGAPSWEGWGCCHTCCHSWVARLSSGPAPRKASKRETKSRSVSAAWHGVRWGHVVPASIGEHSMTSPLQHWARGKGSGHLSHVPFLASPVSYFGGEGQQEQGWPCVSGALVLAMEDSSCSPRVFILAPSISRGK